MKVAGAVLGAGLLLAAVGAVAAATRLDRLHVRTDAAWIALDAALSGRALVMDELGVGPAAGPRTALGGGREDMENELSRALAMLDRTGLDPVRAARLADAEQRVVIARRVYNDAVRDTRALRSHRKVRWLRLAGTAALPRYFEIAEPRVQDSAGIQDGAGV